MTTDARELQTMEVHHWLTPVCGDHAHGPEYKGYTAHRAQVTFTPAAKRVRYPAEPIATVWLFDHPRAVEPGDTFRLETGRLLKAARIERRAHAGSTITKVTLQ